LAKLLPCIFGNFAPSDHTGPKMHMIQTDPSGQFVIANDAGLDNWICKQAS
jgi:Lactonase, 7-bladed beta-propeller